MRPDRNEQIHKELIQTSATVRAYAESEGSKAIVAMMDALAHGYVMSIVSCQPSELIHLQSCIKQIYALRSVITAETENTPKI